MKIQVYKASYFLNSRLHPLYQYEYIFYPFNRTTHVINFIARYSEGDDWWIFSKQPEVLIHPFGSRSYNRYNEWTMRYIVEGEKYWDLPGKIYSSYFLVYWHRAATSYT